MSLRLRLTLAFLALVALIGSVGVASYVVSHRLREQVADLGARHGVDPCGIDLESVCLEFEGFWDPRGSFYATEIEAQGGSQRPRLRGAIQNVDVTARQVTVFGVPIEFDEHTYFESAGGASQRFEDLRSGDRVEVTCEVHSGSWTARKIRTRGIKSSDKIKGIVTATDLDGVAPEAVELHGLLVSLAPSTDVAPESVLRQLSLATQMMVSLERCRVAAHDLVRDFESGVSRGETDAAERLSRAREDFAYCVTQASAGRGGGWHAGGIERHGALDSPACRARPDLGTPRRGFSRRP